MSESDRFIELETKLAFQEDTLRQLNEVVTRQQDQIDTLTAALRALIERVERLGSAAAEKLAPADEIPPHY